MGKKIVVLGSCMIDFVSYAPELPKRGETIRGSSFMINQGGKGANQCFSAAKLGANISLIARLGDEYFGREYLKILESYNIDITYTKLCPGISSGIAQIMVSENIGDNCIVIVPGANNLLHEDDLLAAKSLLESAAVLVCQLEVPLNVTLKALKEFQHGISILNGAPATKDYDIDLLKYCTIFCVNETEAGTFTGLDCENLEQAKGALKRLIEMGCNSVIITVGDKGALFGSKNNEDIVHIQTEMVTAVDTTGAGDCFIGSLAFLIAEYPDLKLEQQIKIACQLASHSVQFSGTHKSFADGEVLKQILIQNNIS